MRTPICDFVRTYCEKKSLRMHMPGHKGLSLLGAEPLDITEIEGADSLYEASGIIRESEENVTALFGSAASFYSTEGSSHCIRAMLYLTLLHAKQSNKDPLILAARNVHKTFVTALGLLGMDVEWIPPAGEESYLSSRLHLPALEKQLAELRPAALYITSPDYLGNRADIPTLARLCHRYGALLLVDNAHGAYLRFLPQSLHPLDLGADLCCDSAHKTLPALTGAAYLHLAHSAPARMRELAKDALALFGSTSPSYLILQSLDALNAYLDGGYREKLADFEPALSDLKQKLTAMGYALVGDEPLKLTLAPKPYGYTGRDLADALAERGIVCEFSDPDYTVLMLSCEQGRECLTRLEKTFSGIPKRIPITTQPPAPYLPQRVLPIREAMTCMRRRIPAEQANGCILAALNLSCPPAVPIAVCGERIDARAIELFDYYGVESCDVLI